MTREEWLMAMVERLRPLFASLGKPLPDRLRVSCGWPASGRAGKNRRLGEAWSATASDDGSGETFISPLLSDPVQVAGVLVHELVHHAVGVEHGHKGPFRKLALAIGLEGKMTATHAGADLAAALQSIADDLGPYPHARMSVAGRKKQTTRMLKVECPECGCLCRMTRQWLTDVGPPTCACGTSMRGPE